MASPAKTQICAASTRFDRYARAPTHSTKMPNSKTRETNGHPLQRFIPYIAAAAMIILTIYYLPNYLFLERATADDAAFLLGSLGMDVQTKVISGKVFLAGVEIVKDCTGVQVMAIFFGMLIPVPNASWGKKLITFGIVSASVYIANVLRIALQLLLVHLSILPWSLAHYPLSLLLGVIGVFVLVLVTDRLMPEFGDFLFDVTRPRMA